MLDKSCNDQLLKRKAQKGYPIVALDRILDEPNVKCLLVNNYPPMRELVQGLVRRGYRDYAFLGGINTLDNRERYQAFTDVLKENGIPFHSESYLTGDYREKSGYQAAKLLLIGERLPQALDLARDQAGVFWYEYGRSRNRLMAGVRKGLGGSARHLLKRIRNANGALAALGARLYRIQQGAVKLSDPPAKHEWIVIWEAYHDQQAALRP